MRDLRGAALLAALACPAWPARGAAPTAEAARSAAADATETGGTTQWARPADAEPSLPGEEVAAPATAATPSSTAKTSGHAGLKALATSEGEARLELADGEERTLRPGDKLGADVVQAVGEGLLVLVRPEQGTAGASTVVVRFDAQGRASVRVYSSSDPTAVAPPEAK